METQGFASTPGGATYDEINGTPTPTPTTPNPGGSTGPTIENTHPPVSEPGGSADIEIEISPPEATDHEGPGGGPTPEAGPGGTGHGGEDADAEIGDADEPQSGTSEPGGMEHPESLGPAAGPGGTGLEAASELTPVAPDSVQPCGADGREWFRSSDDVRTGSVYLSSGPKQVEFSVIDGRAIFEGDIVIGDAAEVEARSNGTPKGLAITDAAVDGLGLTGEQYRWPKGVVPYEFDANLPQATRTIIENAIDHWHRNTLIRLRPRNNEQHFVRFVNQNGCWSYVGMRGGRQDISIGAGCGFGAAVHEIGHALGLWHEQGREDRNNNVTINWQNIQPGREHNFNQHITDGDDIGTYDFDSVMHYGPNAFSVNGQPTIVTRNGEAIGQRDGLSAGDIAALAKLYPAHKITSFPQLRFSALWNAGTQAQVWWPYCTETQFRAKTSELWKSMRVKQMRAVVINNSVRYACMWERGTFGQVWWPNCSEAQFRAMTSKLWSWARPAQVQAFVVGGQVRYSCLWNAGTHGQVWWPNCSEAQFRAKTSELWSWARPAQVQAFVVGGQVRYSCLWDAGAHGQVWWPNCSEAQFRAKTSSLWSWARPAQVQAFVVNNKLRFSCLWNAGTQRQLWWPVCTEEQLRQATSNHWGSLRPAQWFPVSV